MGFKITEEHYTTKLLQANPNNIYVFGDNLCGYGLGGQACIRLEPNAFGLPTKVYPSTTVTSYFNEEDKHQIKPHLAAKFKYLEELATTHTVVFPSAGLGTGLSQLDVRAPSILEFIDDWVFSVTGEHYEQYRN
jgi:hypothetical protein